MIFFVQVRSAYFTHLHKCLLNNYLTCHEERSYGIPNEIKKCADKLELHAIRLALEVNLYRQNMLKMVKNVKHFHVYFITNIVYPFADCRYKVRHYKEKSI